MEEPSRLGVRQSRCEQTDKPVRAEHFSLDGLFF